MRLVRGRHLERRSRIRHCGNTPLRGSAAPALPRWFGEVMGFEGVNPFELLFFPWSCVNVVTLPRRMSASHPFVDHNHFRIYICVVHEIRWVLIGSRGRISLIVPDI